MQIGSVSGGQHLAAPVAAPASHVATPPPGDSDGDQNGNSTVAPAPQGSGRGEKLSVKA